MQHDARQGQPLPLAAAQVIAVFRDAALEAAQAFPDLVQYAGIPGRFKQLLFGHLLPAPIKDIVFDRARKNEGFLRNVGNLLGQLFPGNSLQSFIKQGHLAGIAADQFQENMNKGRLAASGSAGDPDAFAFFNRQIDLV